MTTQIFETTVQRADWDRLFIPVPFEPIGLWGQQDRFYVAGTINDMPYRGSLRSRNGQHGLMVSDVFREQAGIQAGDVVRVSIAPGEAVLDDLPVDFQDDLRMNPDAKRQFDDLSLLEQNIYIDWIDTAAANYTRQQRIQAAVDLLMAGTRRP